MDKLGNKGNLDVIRAKVDELVEAINALDPSDGAAEILAQAAANAETLAALEKRQDDILEQLKALESPASEG